MNRRFVGELCLHLAVVVAACTLGYAAAIFQSPSTFFVAVLGGLIAGKALGNTVTDHFLSKEN